MAWSPAWPRRGQQEPVSCHVAAPAATPRPPVLILQSQPAPVSLGTGSPLAWSVHIIPPTVLSPGEWASPVLRDTSAGLVSAADLLWHVTADFPATARTQPSTYGSAVSKGFKRRYHPSLSPVAGRLSSFVLQVHGQNKSGGRPAARGAQCAHRRRAAPVSHLESPGDRFSSRAVPNVPSPLQARRPGSCCTQNLLLLSATKGRITGWEF